MKIVPLIVLFVLLAFIPVKAVDYVYVDYTVKQRTFGIIGTPNAQYTYVVSQLNGTGTTLFALTSNGTFAST